jgi:hypothetical protein
VSDLRAPAETIVAQQEVAAPATGIEMISRDRDLNDCRNRAEIMSLKDLDDLS